MVSTFRPWNYSSNMHLPNFLCMHLHGEYANFAVHCEGEQWLSFVVECLNAYVAVECLRLNA